MRETICSFQSRLPPISYCYEDSCNKVAKSRNWSISFPAQKFGWMMPKKLRSKFLFCAYQETPHGQFLSDFGYPQTPTHSLYLSKLPSFSKACKIFNGHRPLAPKSYAYSKICPWAGRNSSPIYRRCGPMFTRLSAFYAQGRIKTKLGLMLLPRKGLFLALDSI